MYFSYHALVVKTQIYQPKNIFTIFRRTVFRQQEFGDQQNQQHIYTLKHILDYQVLKQCVVNVIEESLKQQAYRIE